MKNMSRQIQEFKRIMAETLNRLRIILKTAGTLLSDICGGLDIPENVIRDLARLFLPYILKMHENEEGKAKLSAWAEDRAKRIKSEGRQGQTSGEKE